MRQLGKYLLIEPIASGGMAEVWRAEVAGPAGFVKQVAVKLVRADRGDDGEMNQMFIREAQLASLLHHAGIVHVFGLDLVDGRYVIAMELVHGKSLRAVLDRCREANVRFGLPRAVHVAGQVARALAYAHRPVAEGGVAGLVHRDVSPQNVLVSFEGEVKLTDFGIARVEGAGGLTGPGTLKGKIGYMAPEHATGGPVDARADIFALGVMLWEMCAGRRLFARDSDVATLRVLIGDEPISPPSFWNELVPPALDAIVAGALERDPARRTATADEIARRLAEVEIAIARTPEERDLRPLMRRLWPGEVPSRPQATPPPPVEATVQPTARAEAPSPAAAAPSPAPTPAASAAPSAPEDATTETWPARRRTRRALPLAALAGAAVVALALGLRAAGPFAPPSARPAPETAPRVAVAVPGPAADSPGSEATAKPQPSVPASSSPALDAATAPAAAPASVAAPVPLAGAAGEGRDRPAADEARPVATSEPTPAPARKAAKPPVRPAARVRPGVLASADALEGLELPPVGSGEGLLFVNATPWAEVQVDGVPQGHTPREMRLAAGTHRVTLVHPTRGRVEKDAKVRAGERVRVETALGP